MSNLDELAAQGAQKRERDRARDKKRRPKKRKLSSGEKMARNALAGSNLYVLGLSLVLVGVAFGGYLALDAQYERPVPQIGAIAIGVLQVPLVLVVVFRLRDARYHRERDRLRALPFRGNWDSYETQLRKERDNTRVVVQAHYEYSLDQAQAQKVGNAAHALAARGRASSSTRVLTLRSEPIKTWFRGNGDRSSRYSNLGVHKWVKATIEDLMVIHREHPFERIEIETETASV